MFRWIKAVLLLIPRLIKDYCFAISRYGSHPDKYPIKKRYSKLKKLLKIITKRLGVYIDVSGLEKLPKTGKYMMVSNHLSMFDPVAMINVLDEATSFVSKIETENYFAVNKAIKSIDGLFLDRKNLKQQLKIMMKLQEDLKAQNKNWIIYPEGTRNEDPFSLVGEFHHGTFRPAVKANVPIVPVAIYGSQRVLKIKPKYKKYVVSISFLEPLYPDDYQTISTQEIANKVHSDIQRELSFTLRSRNNLLMKKYNKNYNYFK